MQKHFDELGEQGYTILEDLMLREQVQEAVSALKEIYEREKDVVSEHEPGTIRAFNLTARAEIFRQMLQFPELVACMKHMLDADYVLSDMGARSALPGIARQGLHRDGYTGRLTASSPAMAQSMFALCDFTEKNGGTHFVPGSHSSGITPDEVKPGQEKVLICSAGTVLVYDHRMLHAGGTNSSDEIRYSVQGFHCNKVIKPFCDHTRSIPPEVVASASPLMRRLWGFEYQSACEVEPRDFRVIDALNAKPVFEYGSREGRYIKNQPGDE